MIIWALLILDYSVVSGLEEVSDTNGELASVTSVVGIAGVTVDKTVADVEADDVEEINGYSAAEHNIKTTTLIFIIVVVNLGIPGETGYRTLNLGVRQRLTPFHSRVMLLRDWRYNNSGMILAHSYLDWNRVEKLFVSICAFLAFLHQKKDIETQISRVTLLGKALLRKVFGHR